VRGKSGTRDVTARDDEPQARLRHLATHRDQDCLDGNLGYLRIAQMAGDAGFLDGLDASMQTFRATKGLVIDVRGNGGGSRDALRRLAPYLLPENGAPVVGNVAAIFAAEGRGSGSRRIGRSRPLPRPTGRDGPTRSARRSRSSPRGFKPSVEAAPPGSSLAVALPRARQEGQREGVRLRQEGRRAHRPRLLLATDVFAAALGALPNVKLVGEATSGGSGGGRLGTGCRAARSAAVVDDGVVPADGVLFEGNGVVPDVAVSAEPAIWSAVGNAVLQRALELLR
jgi:hypothetical protein